MAIETATNRKPLIAAVSWLGVQVESVGLIL
jgi:hypothetical protein